MEHESSTNLDQLSTHDYIESYILSSPEYHHFSESNSYCSTPLSESLQSILSSLSEDIFSAGLSDSIPRSSPESSGHELSP